MKFTELEEYMIERGVDSLADIARALNTTPQAVSNWKARDQVPYHIVAKIKQNLDTKNVESRPSKNISNETFQSNFSIENESGSISDIFITLSEQLKLLILVPFIIIFINFTYFQFIKIPTYTSSVTVLFPENNTNPVSGIAGIASQFGVNVPQTSEADLSSPILFPDLLNSRTFAEKILNKSFFSKKYEKNLSLLAILNEGLEPDIDKTDQLITESLSSLSGMISLSKDLDSPFTVITITADEPLFAKELASVVVEELEKLNRFFKTLSVNEKTLFITNRIKNVETELRNYENKLLEFNEKNRQVSSPALQLELDRLAQEVDVQKNIYLTLKQQLELAKIEEVQKTSIVQILDEPQIALYPNNKNLISTLLMSSVFGVGLGVLLAFIRGYINNADKFERKKHRRVKNYVKNKGKSFLLDNRVSAIMLLVLISGVPFYFGHKSDNPVFFGMYSSKLFVINIIYVFAMLVFAMLYFKNRKNNI